MGRAQLDHFACAMSSTRWFADLVKDPLR